MGCCASASAAHLPHDVRTSAETAVVMGAVRVRPVRRFVSAAPVVSRQIDDGRLRAGGGVAVVIDVFAFCESLAENRVENRPRVTTGSEGLRFEV